MRRKYPQCRSRGGRSRPHRKPQHQLRRRCRSTRCGVPQTRASDARGTDVLMGGVLTAKSEEKKQASKPASDSFSESAPRPAALGASAGLPLFLGGGVQKKIAAGASENSGVQFKCDCGGFSSGECEECRDRKSTRLNSSHSQISYAVFCLKKKRPTSSMMGLKLGPVRIVQPGQMCDLRSNCTPGSAREAGPTVISDSINMDFEVIILSIAATLACRTRPHAPMPRSVCGRWQYLDYGRVRFPGMLRRTLSSSPFPESSSRTPLLRPSPVFFFFSDRPPPELSPLSPPDPLPC